MRIRGNGDLTGNAGAASLRLVTLANDRPTAVITETLLFLVIDGC